MRTDTIPVPEKAPPAMLVTVTLPTFSGISSENAPSAPSTPVSAPSALTRKRMPSDSHPA